MPDDFDLGPTTVLHTPACFSDPLEGATELLLDVLNVVHDLGFHHERVKHGRIPAGPGETVPNSQGITDACRQVLGRYGATHYALPERVRARIEELRGGVGYGLDTHPGEGLPSR